ACDSTVTANGKAHYHLLRLYAENELEQALNKTWEAVARALHLSIIAQENPSAQTTWHRGRVAPVKVRMQWVNSSLSLLIRQMQV
ncbi:glycoprotein 3, partial [Escherichia coli]|nr:glycoprotein 3 [Escherichia coli]